MIPQVQAFPAQIVGPPQLAPTVRDRTSIQLREAPGAALSQKGDSFATLAYHQRYAKRCCWWLLADGRWLSVWAVKPPLSITAPSLAHVSVRNTVIGLTRLARHDGRAAAPTVTTMSNAVATMAFVGSRAEV
jgi:hypothetical protein